MSESGGELRRTRPSAGFFREAVVEAIEETEGRIHVGSSTEVFDIVPLENFLAMREAAMEYRF